MKDFIYLNQAALSPLECEDIIDWFEKNSEHHKPGVSIVYDNGEVSKVVDDTKKKSTDLSTHKNVFQIPCLQPLHKALEFSLDRYEEKYPYLKKLPSWGMSDLFVFKRYYPNEGYYVTHCESTGDIDTCKRMLVWMVYLNDVIDDGGTAFPTQKVEFQARCGDILIWPAYWTHPHHGIVSPTETKYIASGWFSFIGQS